MPARPIWRGHLRLALVSCPVALWNARHDRSSIRFNMINPDTGNRIKMVTQDAETGKELGLPRPGQRVRVHRRITTSFLKEEDFDRRQG